MASLCHAHKQLPSLLQRRPALRSSMIFWRAKVRCRLALITCAWRKRISAAPAAEATCWQGQERRFSPASLGKFAIMDLWQAASGSGTRRTTCTARAMWSSAFSAMPERAFKTNRSSSRRNSRGDAAPPLPPATSARCWHESN